MSKVEIASAFVEEQIGAPVFVLKITEPHSRKDEHGNYQTVARTFYDLKASRESGIDLAQFGKGARVKVWGNQRTEVREHEGKKFYTLVVWADRIEVLQAAQQPQGGAGQSQWATTPPATFQGATSDPGGFGDFTESDKNPF